MFLNLMQYGISASKPSCESRLTTCRQSSSMNPPDTAKKLAFWVSLANRWLNSWSGRIGLMIAVAVVYVFAYVNYGEVRPGSSPQYPLGWWGWFDQGQYLKCAAGLARASLTSDTYLYPLGYPAMGALFYAWMPDHAFLIPDLILVVGIGLLLFEIAKRLITPVEALLLMAVFIFCYRGLLSDTLVVPWNTIPTHFLAYAVILLVAFGPATRTRVLLAAGCVGFMYLCRPADAFCMALLVGVGVLRLSTWSERFWTGLWCLATVSLFWGFVLLVNQTVFGSWITPYEKIVRSIGFGSYPFLQKLFWLMVNGVPVFHERGITLTSHFPWLLLVIPGAACFAHRYRLGAFGVFLSIGITYFLYFQFNDFWPTNLFPYHLVHYLAWTFPILALLAYLSIKEAWKYRVGRWSYGLMLSLGATAWFLTLTENVVGTIPSPAPAVGEVRGSTADPVDWILFRGVRNDPLPLLYDGNRELVRLSEFYSVRHFDGQLVLLSKKAGLGLIRFDGSTPGTLHSVEFGRFVWRAESIEEALSNILEKTWQRPRVVSVTRIDEIDVTGPGPEDRPDGKPDQIIELDVSTSASRRITVWDLETNDYSAHWISIPTAQRWWLIKLLPSPTKLPEGRTALRLCFANVGQLEAAPSATLRGMDDFGRVHVRVEIRLPR